MNWFENSNCSDYFGMLLMHTIGDNLFVCVLNVPFSVFLFCILIQQFTSLCIKLGQYTAGIPTVDRLEWFLSLEDLQGLGTLFMFRVHSLGPVQHPAGMP